MALDNLLQKQTVPVARAIMDASEEYTVNGDFVLPEYCPDVAVVLKCMITPRIHSRQWSGDQLLLDGTAVIRVLYLDEGRQCVRTAEFGQPVSCSLKAAEGADGAAVRVELLPEYVNCRATSPRRLEVHGAFTVRAQAEKSGTLELVTDAGQEGLYTRCQPVPVTVPRCGGEKVLTVSEALSFDSQMPPAEQLLGGETRACVNECRLLSGKAIVKGQIYLHELYTDDTAKGTTHVLEYTLPFSQILDLDGAEEGQLCTAGVSILSDLVQPGVGNGGENMVLDVTVKLLVQVQLYEPTTVPLILDAYDTHCPVTLERQELSLRALTGTQQQTATLQKSFDLPAEPLQEILDMWVQPQPMPGRCEDGKAVLNGRMLISMLVRDPEGTVAYYERPEDFALEYPAAGNEVQVDCTVTGLSYSTVGGRVELRVTMAVSLTLWDRTEQTAVCGVSLQEDQPYPKEKAAVKVYYAEPGETVWGVASHCHTSPKCVCGENNLREETITAPTVLIIPME